MGGNGHDAEDVEWKEAYRPGMGVDLEAVDRLRERRREEDEELLAALPRDPMNPLDKAHDLREYKESRYKRFPNAAEEPDWDHLPYLRRSPSPNRDRTDGPMWPTRRG